MAMFDMKDAEDVELHKNESSDETLLQAERVRRLSATGNKAGLQSDPAPRDLWAKIGSFANNLTVQILGGVAAAVLGAWLIKYLAT